MLFSCTQHDGGRKNRNLLLADDGSGDMDMEKVVDWVKHSKLSQSKQDNEPRCVLYLRMYANMLN